MDTIGSRLKQLRETAGYTMGQVEEAAKLSTGSINKWEKDKSIPGGKAIIALAKFFNVTTDYILCVTENNQQNKEHDPYIELTSRFKLLSIEEQSKIEGIIEGMLLSREMHCKKPQSSNLTNGEEAVTDETA